MRIVVIGAGIVGVQLAVELARRGADVTLIERDEPGTGTTAGSLAWIDASHPGIAPYLKLRLLGLRGWRRLQEELARPPWLSLEGTLVWAHGADREAMEAHIRRLGHAHQPQRLTAEEVLAREPDLLLAADAEPVYRFEGEGWVRTGPAISALLGRGRAAGMRLRTGTEVRELTVDGAGRVTGVLAEGARVPGDAVISGTGRWTESLLSPAGVEVAMLAPGDARAHVAGLVVRTTPLSARLASVLLADGVLIRPDVGGRVLLHSDAHDAALDGETPSPGSAEALLALLPSRIRGTERAGVEAAHVCVRAIPADLRPVAGWALEGLYVLATHSGVTLAPALAGLAAAEVLDGQDRPELAPFRPGRLGASRVSARARR